MNAFQITQYIQFVADHLLVSLRQPKLYNIVNPFEWMELISLQGKTNSHHGMMMSSSFFSMEHWKECRMHAKWIHHTNFLGSNESPRPLLLEKIFYGKYGTVNSDNLEVA